MQIILLLLKILGILLLSLFILLLIVLLHPVLYKISGKLKETNIIQGKIWWLFRIISVEFFVNGSKVSYHIKLFGREFLLSKNRDTKIDSKTHSLEKDNLNKNVSAKEEPKDRPEKNVLKPDNIQNVSSENPEKIPIFFDTLRKPFTCLKMKWIQAKEKFISIQKFLSNLKVQWKDERNHQAVVAVWQEILLFLSKWKPRSVKAELDFGTSDPALTGQITGILSMLPIVYKYDTHIYPNFLSDKTYIQGEFAMKGRLFPYQAGILIIRLFKNKNVRRMFTIFQYK